MISLSIVFSFVSADVALKMKSKKPKKPRRPPGEKAEQAIKPPPPQEEQDDRMDFGGIPNRDLKKNLGGCG
jgi:hypothetical protein